MKRYHQCLGKLMEVVFCWQAQYINNFLFMTVNNLFRSFLRIIIRSSVHRLQLGFVNVFDAPIVFRCFTTFNVIYLCISVREVVALKCCSKWAANESDFCLFLIWRRISVKMTVHSFLKFLPCVTYINSITHLAFYLVD